MNSMHKITKNWGQSDKAEIIIWSVEEYLLIVSSSRYRTLFGSWAFHSWIIRKRMKQNVSIMDYDAPDNF